jgi:hypothetical protein
MPPFCKLSECILPNTLYRKKLVIVGCGAAATLLLAELAETLDSPLEIYLKRCCKAYGGLYHQA